MTSISTKGLKVLGEFRLRYSEHLIAQATSYFSNDVAYLWVFPESGSCTNRIRAELGLERFSICLVSYFFLRIGQISTIGAPFN
ncbi:hypothetical protein SpiGrapes_2272 [Sphaerochaeta pleomorpha str. Grapes]|uniref:Uncharacterized protein n=1 Tax=Sphaerochaeta pleomorpha (strain ATCC BAA-1885 / DSM 22778 / Grapes) TaxID=158190 RepID=G8QSB8_SPHPG|nr:hypothetical protein SpiGrapes_2272 [Sphaerochaeta pleomorpha str. Grapes]